MKREERERLVDGALARALAPKQVEPRPGFEERLLAGLAAQPEQRPWWRWLWGPALAAAAVIAIVFGIQAMHRPAPQVIETRTIPPTAPQTATVVQPNTATTDQVPATATHRVPVVARARHPRHIAPGTRPAGIVAKTGSRPFPATTLTESERALLTMLRQNPTEAGLLSDRQDERNKEAEKYMEQALGPTTQQERQ